MATLDTIQPYVEQLFDDTDVRKNLARASANLRGAKARADKKKSKKKALQDPTLRHRLMESARAAFAAGEAIKEAPRKQRRRSRLKAFLGLALVGGAAYVAVDETARGRVMGLFGSPQPEQA